MEDFNSKVMELASELAHNKTLFDSGDLCQNEDDMYSKESDGENYTDEIQGRFNDHYDDYLNKISKVFKEPFIYVLSNDLELDGIDTPGSENFDKKHFITRAEKEGRVFSLNEFSNNFNDNNIAINQENDFILIN